MSNDNMGNLEKLGILVIVILVVVVGVVAITPSDALFGDPEQQQIANEESLDDVPMLGAEEKPAIRVERQANANERIKDFQWPGREEESARIPVGPETPSKERLLPPEDRDHEAHVGSANVEPDPPYEVVEPVQRDVVLPPPVEAGRRTETGRRTEAGSRTVEVQKGDTFIRIAQRELGDGNLYREIEKLNPDVDPRRIRPGDSLLIPTKEALAAGTSRTRRETASDRNGLSRGAEEGRTYVVKPGQSASQVSEAVYGTSVHWRLILDHNGIEDPLSMQANITLKIPELPTKFSNVAPERKPTPVAPVAPAGDERLYLVKPGDTLSTIASKELGSSSRWREILELNEMKDARDLRAGTTIRLPR